MASAVKGGPVHVLVIPRVLHATSVQTEVETVLKSNSTGV